MNKLELFSLVDCFAWISTTIEGYGFLSGFSSFDGSLIVVSKGKDVFIKI